MSNTTCSAADRDLILLEYAGSLSTVYIYLMVPTVLGTLLLPFLFALFYFSNATQRHTPIFILVTLAIILCLAQSIQQATIHMRMLYNPVDTTSRVFPHAILISTLILELLPNWVADLALLYRIVAVYPRSITSARRLALIVTPPIIFKLVRVACWIGFLVALTRPGGQLPHFLWTKEERWWTVVERLFTAVDNTYATAFFLWKLRGVIQFKNDVYRFSSTGKANSVGSRIRALFWLSATNFVIPVPLCFLQVGFAAALPNSIVYEIVQHFINFVSVVCVAFATVWYSTATLRSSLREDAKSSPVPSALRFQRANTTDSPRSSADSEMGLSSGRLTRKYTEKQSRPVRVDWTLPTPVSLGPVPAVQVSQGS